MPSKAEERQMAAKLYVDTTLSVEQIGAHFGVSRQTIHSWLKAEGVQMRGPMGARKKVPGVDTGGVPVVPPEPPSLAARFAVMQAEHADLRRNQERMLAEFEALSQTMARIEGSLSALLAILSKR